MIPGRRQAVDGAGLVPEQEGGTAERGSQEPGTQAEDMVQRADSRHDIAGTEGDGASGFGGGVKEVAMREFDPARLAGGTRGVEDGEAIVGGPPPGPRSPRPKPAEMRSSHWKMRSSYQRSSSPTVTRWLSAGSSTSKSSKICRKSIPKAFSAVTAHAAPECLSA